MPRCRVYNSPKQNKTNPQEAYLARTANSHALLQSTITNYNCSSFQRHDFFLITFLFFHLGSDFFLLHYPEEDVVQNADHGECTPHDGKHRRQKVVPLATPLLDVDAHRAKVVAELRLRDLKKNKTHTHRGTRKRSCRRP